MLQLLQIELYKIFKKPRTYIAFGVIAVFIILIQIGLYADGESYVQFILNSVTDSLDIDVKAILNGYKVCYIILNLLLIHVPILVALVAGDMLSGEAAMGTMRLLASKPVSRVEIVLAKFLAIAAYVFVMLIWIAIIALLLSMVLFGTNDLLVEKAESLRLIPADDVFWRFLAAFGFAFLAMLVVGAIALFFSALSENSIGPIVATVGIVIVCTLISEMQIPVYQRYIRPYLFTTYMLGWKGFFYINYTEENEVIAGSVQNMSAVWKSVYVLLAYLVGLLAASAWLFRKKDIVT